MAFTPWYGTENGSGLEQDVVPYRTTDEVTIEWDFGPELPSGVTLSSAGTTVASVYKGTDATPSSIVNGAATTTSNKVAQSITGMTDEVEYLVVVQGVMSNGDVIHGAGLLRCSNAVQR